MKRSLFIISIMLVSINGFTATDFSQPKWRYLILLKQVAPILVVDTKNSDFQEDTDLENENTSQKLEIDFNTQEKDEEDPFEQLVTKSYKVLTSPFTRTSFIYSDYKKQYSPPLAQIRGLLAQINSMLRRSNPSNIEEFDEIVVLEALSRLLKELAQLKF